MIANSSLAIHKVTVEDADYYTCREFDNIGRTPGSVLTTFLAVFVSEIYTTGNFLFRLCCHSLQHDKYITIIVHFIFTSN